MSTEEKIFKDDWQLEFGLVKGEVIWFLKSHPNLALKSLCRSPVDDVLSWNKNHDYRPKLFEYNDKEIASYFITSELLDMFLQSKDKSITSIDIPSEALEDPSWMLNFPNLETLNTDSFGLKSETYQFIKANTKIKIINAEFIYNTYQYDEPLNDHQISINYGSFCQKFIDDNIEVNCTKYNPPYLNIKIKELGNSFKRINEFIQEYLSVKTFNIVDQTDVKLEYDKTSGLLNYTNHIHPELLKNIVSVLEENNMDLKMIKLHIDNKTYTDFYALKGLDELYDFQIDYGNYTYTTYDNFLGMRETLDYYTSLINAQDLSPLEKIMYAYDLMKSFKYNESEKHTKTSRNIPEIISSGEIVCRGYSEFFRQLLKEVGIDSLDIDVVVPVDGELEYHARNIVRVDDDKYNIHGDFAFDSTWDSYKELYKVKSSTGEERIANNLNEGDVIITQFGRTPLYRYFLVPASDYLSIFKQEELPKMFTNEEKDYHKRLYLEQQFNIERPDLETFKKVLYNVRLAQGYSKDRLPEEIDSVVYANEYICNNYTHIPFFQDHSRNKR